ncbi:MAG TPA: metal-sensing transcriptional repressor [Tepiditoga sp.]|nr:metal-sensing transcriptional repressor [Thermotogota bacterium]HOO73960.1 metal-sensing transcriptional repressor [Tepiditoga sp.]
MKHNDSLKTIKTAKGQIEAVIKMIESERYCIDISKQLLATISLLKKAHTEILKKHMETCVRDAALSSEKSEIDTKLKELEDVLDYLNKTI